MSKNDLAKLSCDIFVTGIYKLSTCICFLNLLLNEIKSLGLAFALNGITIDMPDDRVKNSPTL